MTECLVSGLGVKTTSILSDTPRYSFASFNCQITITFIPIFNSEN